MPEAFDKYLSLKLYFGSYVRSSSKLYHVYTVLCYNTAWVTLCGLITPSISVGWDKSLKSAPPTTGLSVLSDPTTPSIRWEKCCIKMNFLKENTKSDKGKGKKVKAIPL